MNMHVAPVSPAPLLHPTFRSRDVGDRDLIRACKRACILFTKERSAEQRLFDAIDGGKPEARSRAASRTAIGALTAAVAHIAAIQARTPEGLAYKAALLAPWVAAGMTLCDEAGPGQDLALSIAQDARIIGMQDVAYRPRRAAKG